MAPKEHTGPTVTVYSVEDDSPSSADAINSSVTNGQEERKRKRQKHQGREAGIAPLWVCLLIESRTDVDDSPLMVPRAIEVTGPRPEATSGTPGPELSRLVAPTAPASSTPTAPPTSQTSVSSTASSIVSTPAAAELDQDAAPSLLRLGTTGGAQTMEQMAHDISEILRQQFLLHFFTIFICLDHIWLLRWDRAGLVVSEPFNFAEEPQHLYTFFYRFASMDDVQRGRDPTVVPASEAEVKVMRSIDQFDSAWHKTQYTATMTAGWPIYKVLIPEEDVISTAELSEGRKDRADSELSEGRERGFLVGKPYFMSDSPTGRGTRGYIAYDVAEHRLVFLKEYWRLDAPTYHPEVAAGDVLDATGGMHHTRAQDFFPDPPPKHIQYRIILKEIGKPLEEYETSFELMSAMYCCIYAHMKAWTEGEVLHRDISRANLLMYPYRNDDGEIEWLGLIVDWGLCKYKDELGLPQVQNTRSVRICRSRVTDD
ncbi:hypothetical protein EVJ58_g10393 [Rhodofomes roseus]|uniref:Fungal-type protein kinase domain-containing protein n=1 Tax=Rhodofomes roseus TaxID=34475 RepID=A0A4Y9XQV4_9APHY|nr:hypothetical protein EVJ58_g10393 [Rhodofomes roseus]